MPATTPKKDHKLILIETAINKTVTTCNDKNLTSILAKERFSSLCKRIFDINLDATIYFNIPNTDPQVKPITMFHLLSNKIRLIIIETI